MSTKYYFPEHSRNNNGRQFPFTVSTRVPFKPVLCPKDILSLLPPRVSITLRLLLSSSFCTHSDSCDQMNAPAHIFAISQSGHMALILLRPCHIGLCLGQWLPVFQLWLNKWYLVALSFSLNKRERAGSSALMKSVIAHRSKTLLLYYQNRVTNRKFSWFPCKKYYVLWD